MHVLFGGMLTYSTQISMNFKSCPSTFLTIYLFHSWRVIFSCQALMRKYAPAAIVIGVVLLLFWVKNKIW
jgi:hypothetical protein